LTCVILCIQSYLQYSSSLFICADNYIIPLARKLDKCGVFGVSHHEFLNYAQENKKEWEKKGKDITADMLAKCEAKYGTEIRRTQEPETIASSPAAASLTKKTIFVDV
jgi:hypothetical protein